jgi:hypothetical protein
MADKTSVKSSVAKQMKAEMMRRKDQECERKALGDKNAKCK